MKELRISFDLDGVIADVDQFKLGSADLVKNLKDRKELYKYYYSSRKVQVRPSLFTSNGDQIYIITSRNKELEDLTVDWLRKNDICYDKLIFVNHRPFKTMSLEEWYKMQAERKAKILEKLSIDVYFEDTPSVVKYLREYCPDIIIIQYGDRII